MDDANREVLARVADGSLSPDQALRLMDGDGPDEPRSRRDRPGPSTATPGADAMVVQRLRVSSDLGIVTVMGDVQVREAVAEGPCTMRRQGATLVITGDNDDGVGAYRVRSGLTLRAGVAGRRRILVRANPDLALELEIAAGKAEVVGMRGPVKADIELGKLLMSGFEGPVDIRVAAGKVEMSGRLDHGDSSITCEIGRVDVHLGAGSDVRITGRAELGSVKLPSSGSRTSQGTVTLGNGTATLDVKTAAGSVEVRA